MEEPRIEVSGKPEVIKSMYRWLKDTKSAKYVLRSGKTSLAIQLTSQNQWHLVHDLASWFMEHPHAKVRLTSRRGSADLVGVNGIEGKIAKVFYTVCEDVAPHYLDESLKSFITLPESRRHEPELLNKQHKGSPAQLTLPITIYLSDESTHQQVEKAVKSLLLSAGLSIFWRSEPERGSWFRSMKAKVTRTVPPGLARDAAATAIHSAESRLVTSQEAAITATMMQNLGPLLGALAAHEGRCRACRRDLDR